MRCVVTGAAGQLGREIVRQWGEEAVALDRSALDVTASAAAIAQVLAPLAPQVCINCAAYNHVDRAESEPAPAFAVNAWGAAALAEACQSLGCRLVHISTDYVFGLHPSDEPIPETAAPGPVNVYGLSKLCGEYLIRQRLPEALIVRTCGLYGPCGPGGKGGNFVETILRRTAAGVPLRVVHDQYCTPSYTADVAATVIALVRRAATGIVHVVNGGACSWYQFAQAIVEMSGRTVPVTPIRSEEYPAAARRPRYSVLACCRLAEYGLPPLRHWRDALADYLRRRSLPAPHLPLSPGGHT